MHIFYGVLTGFVAGVVLGWLYGNRVTADVLAELKALRASAAKIIEPKE